MKEETLGQVFKRYREADKIKISVVERDTNISNRMIVALENDNYTILPDDLYTRNLIKTYANYLGLDYNKLLVLYEQGQQQDKQINPVQKKSEVRVFLTPQRTRFLVIFVCALILLIYLGYQLINISKPPQLEVFKPSNDIIITDNFIEIKGQSEKEARVYINEKEIYLDSQGNFSATIDLQKGLNIIKISAVKKHSKAKTIYREILVQ